MRDFKGMKRQRSRNRNNGGGKPQQHNANRAFESNGPDGVKIRGAAQHVFEKYQQLARDAVTAGDRVLAESYQQHAEHYFRVLRAVQPQRSASDIIGRDAFASGYDIDFEDESGGGGEGDSGAEAAESDSDRSDGRSEWRQENRSEPRRDDRQRDDRPRDDRPRDDRPRDERPREDRYRDAPRERNFNRDDRPRDERPREERPRDDRPRDDRPRDDRSREDRPRNDRARNRDDRPRYDQNERAADPLAVVEPQATPLTRDPEPLGSPILRSGDGDISHAPAFLQARAETRPEPTAEEGEARPRARRRRAPRTFDAAAGETASAPADAGEDA